MCHDHFFNSWHFQRERNPQKLFRFRNLFLKVALYIRLVITKLYSITFINLHFNHNTTGTLDECQWFSMIMSHLLRFLQPFQPSTCLLPRCVCPFHHWHCKASGNVLSISSELQALGSWNESQWNQRRTPLWKDSHRVIIDLWVYYVHTDLYIIVMDMFIVVFCIYSLL